MSGLERVVFYALWSKEAERMPQRETTPEVAKLSRSAACFRAGFLLLAAFNSLHVQGRPVKPFTSAASEAFGRCHHGAPILHHARQLELASRLRQPSATMR
jgi:hypothetical protein